ncbi:berberine bridge enzyme-like 26 [Aristolochia californica]|uniref:berberine bridge enzyme-like 26 n=1 Tax=Aristolochia californica TaxID=171875 RepID=UPI0035E0E343
MEFRRSSVLYMLLSFISLSFATSSLTSENFLQCLSTHFPSSTKMSEVLSAQNTTSYTSILQSSIQNLRFLSSPKLDPLFVITPTNESQIQATVMCCKAHGIELRARSGGHDYEGLSYTSNDPFVVVDLINMRSVSVDIKEGTAWVQAGATSGELYYRIAEKSAVHGFPAALCPSVGIGGLIAGGGIGTMMRKFGLAADNVLDVHIVNSDGLILDRKSMGEDHFWALRGGGAASFGVILSWKIKLVPVPPKVTVFTVRKTLEQHVTMVVNRWQYMAEKCHENLFIRVIFQSTSTGGKKSILALFNAMHLGDVDELLKVTRECFPELGLQATDCTETSWVEAVMYIGGYPSGTSREVLLTRKNPMGKASFKAKSDFVKQPISEADLALIWKFFSEEVTGAMLWEPMGGRMSKIPETELPFPHRKGYLYNVQYVVQFINGKDDSKGMDWINRLYRHMTPHVSKYPRASYLNYRDLDLGTNPKGNSNYFLSSIWGEKYFQGNYRRLALVKAKVDKCNFFRNEQSVPPFSRSRTC